MKRREFKVKLPSGEEVVVIALRRGIVNKCFVVGEDSILRLEKVPVNSFMVPNRYKHLPHWPFCDFSKGRVIAIQLKNERKIRTQVRYSVNASNGTVMIFKSMKKAVSHIISLGKEFDSLFVLSGISDHKILTSSGVNSFVFEKSRPPKFSMKTLKREWKRIEKKISV